MTPEAASKLYFDMRKADDATQSTLQESDMSIMDSFVDDNDHQPNCRRSEPSREDVLSRSLKTAEHPSETSPFECASSIEMGDLSVFSSLSMDTTLEKSSSHVSSLEASDLSLADEFTELLISFAIKEQDNVVYYLAVAMCASKYFSILDMVLAAAMVIYIQREKSPTLDRFLQRLQLEACDAIMDIMPEIPFLPFGNQSSTNQRSALEERLDKLAEENKELKSQLESEQWQVQSLQQSLSRKETILESEVVNRATFEQSSELLQSIHDHEKTQLKETVKRLEDEIASQKQAMETMERQAVQRDELLANILHNFERSEATLFERTSRRRRSERGPSASVGNPTLQPMDMAPIPLAAST